MTCDDQLNSYVESPGTHQSLHQNRVGSSCIVWPVAATPLGVGAARCTVMHDAMVTCSNASSVTFGDC